ncbi:hypothetical protein PAXINDRAFT_12140 [Paxillus involutus ATCC 200175]|uniref:Uncharacterized protein n=1 Tax=Paxillus involutus ATCC 200175 TaxID=664439 RepID=A0A0C9U820_PAXIN|nr:hypothetical protein PAXINDRAFT_12140 [Paxillus involutus ATCC 200175]
MSTPAEKSHVVQMLGDVIFLDLEGIITPWDTYFISLDIESLGRKKIVFRFKDIPALDVSQPVIIQKEAPCGPITPKVEGDIEDVKIEAGDGDISMASLYPCQILKKPSERFCVRSIDPSNVANEVKQRKRAVQSVYAWDYQRDAQCRKTA